MSKTSSPLSFLEKNFSNYINELKALVRIPSISFDGFDPKTVQDSAKAVQKLLEKTKLKNIETINIKGTHPYVYGEWIQDPNLPTVLLYAHHDVQPVGREELWKTPPFEPTEVDSETGKRLFGRGTADDKAGILIHVAAIDSYLQTVGKLPVNIKVIIEGEEECGSTHLEEFLELYKEKLHSDIILLTDTANFDCGIPSLTIALRGMIVLNLELRSLNKTIHSGMWGGSVPDPVMALSKVLASLTDENGEIAVPSIRELFPKISPKLKEQLDHLPLDEKRFRDQSGLISSAKLFHDKNKSAWERIWYQPSLTVNALQASSKEQAGNIVCDTAWTRISVRIPPQMDANKVQTELLNFIKKQIPWGLELTVNIETAVNPWNTDPFNEKNKAPFKAASQALKEGFENNVVFMGCGGTIPFVKPFSNAFDGAPVLMIGVEDPYTNAHGENESLLLDDFYKACKSEIILLEKLAKAYKN